MRFIEPAFTRKYFIPPQGGDDWPDASWAYYSRNPVIRMVYYARLRESLKLVDNARTDQSILDIGTGCGVLIPSLAQYGKVSAVDREEKFLSKARKLCARYNIPADIRNADILHLPFRNSMFDTVTCISILEHVPDLDAAFTEIRRVMKRGGALVVGVPIEKFLVKGIFNIFGLKEKEDRGHCSHYTVIEQKLGKYFTVKKIRKIPRHLPHSLSLYKIYYCIKG